MTKEAVSSKEAAFIFCRIKMRGWGKIKKCLTYATTFDRLKCLNYLYLTDLCSKSKYVKIETELLTIGFFLKKNVINKM